MELERRITGLENDNLHDRLGDTAKNPNVAASHTANAVPSILGRGGQAAASRQVRSELKFSKKRTAPTLSSAGGTVFSVMVVGKCGGRGLEPAHPPRPSGGIVQQSRGRKGPESSRMGRQDLAIGGFIETKKHGKKRSGSENMQQFTDLRGQMDERKGDSRYGAL